MTDELSEKEISYTYMLSDQDAYVIFKPDGDFINPQRLCEYLNALEQRVEGLEFAARQALMAIEEGYDTPKIRDDLREALAAEEEA